MTGCRKVTARCFCLLLMVLVLWATQDLYAKKKPPLHPVNLNTASSAELQQVPGIGPSTAEKILQARKSYGAFKSVADLQAIRGIGPKKLDKMRKYLTVAKPPQTSKSATHAVAPGKSPAAKAPPPKKAAPTPKTLPPNSSDDEEN
jgi:comEA protein